MSTRILVADDHRILREGLCNLLNRQSDMEVVGHATDGREAVKKTRKLSPDVVVMDLSMPGLNGIEATEQIMGQGKTSKVLCLSMHSERHFVADVLSAGAMGYLLKDCASEELINAIRVVASGKAYLSPDIAGTVVKDYVRHRPKRGSSVLASLSEREREVLQMIAEGCPSREIARSLCLSVKTISTHREHIMAKLNVKSVAELTKCALREGVTQLN